MAVKEWRFTSHKYWLAPGGIPWANTYEAVTDNEVLVDDPLLEDLADAIVRFEQELHVTSVFIDRVTISTYGQEGPVYDPEALRTIQKSVNGLRNAGASERIDLNGVYNVRRSANFGRAGKLAFRGVLIETDINASASGFWQLVPASPIAPGGADWAAAYTEIEPFLSPNNLGITLSLIGSYGPLQAMVIRPVTSMTPLGAGFNRMNHKWFNTGS